MQAPVVESVYMPEPEDLFETTRGRLLLLLCRGPLTVNELMEELGVTDNAVRAHLANLQQSGLVRSVGLRPGVRKPHVDYELTPKARRLFPGAHEPVLRTLVDVLHERLPREQVEPVLKEVARRVLASWAADLNAATPRGRLAELVERLKRFTAGVALREQDDRTVVQACGCPLASVTAEHPDACRALAAVLGELLGGTVREACDRADTPRCCFEITDSL